MSEIKFNILNCIDAQKTEYTDQEYRNMVESLANLDQVEQHRLKAELLKNVIKEKDTVIKQLKKKIDQLTCLVRNVSTKFALTYDPETRTCH